MLFKKIVTLTKRNHVYFGKTESNKFSVSLEEIHVDINNIFDGYNSLSDSVDSLVSNYISPSGYIREMGASLSDMEKSLEKRIFIQANQEPIF
jgi:hypothetical protein